MDSGELVRLRRKIEADTKREKAQSKRVGVLWRMRRAQGTTSSLTSGNGQIDFPRSVHPSPRKGGHGHFKRRRLA